MEPTQLYKLLNPDGTTPQTGFQWPAPGVWLPAVKGDLTACANGYHLVTLAQALEWSGPELWTVETRGRVIDDGDKHVARRARRLERVPGWNDRNLRLFACDCAERALARVPNPDPRSVNAIAVSRRFATDAATSDELAAAWHAAWDAAWPAAWHAAWAAAWDAAWPAAWHAAWAAAWAAARAAARDAARAAARAAAWHAARAAARDAARAAERDWQIKSLEEYVFGNAKAPGAQG